MAISRDEVVHVARLARLELSEAELERFAEQLSAILEAVGKPWLVTPDMIKPGAAVLDVGINRTEHGLRGDVDPSVVDVAGFMTPVPGGVGPMTIASLLRNTVKAARYQAGELAFPLD